MSEWALYNEDCIVGMNKIPDKSVDLILCDMPYQETALKWDKILPLDKVWAQYERVIKNNGIIALFASEPFTSQLIQSNLPLFRYKWIWRRGKTGFLNVSYRPLREFEEIVIFSKGTVGSLSKNPIRYFPQGVVEVNKTKRNRPNSTWRVNKGYPATGSVLNTDKEFRQKYTNHPSDIIEGMCFNNKVKRSHPTEKPVNALEYLIKTYTQEGDLVLDNCAGSGSTGEACLNTGRDFVGFEINQEYYELALERLRNV